MSVHPYRQKVAQAAPYPVDELEQFTKTGTQPLDGSTQLNRTSLPASMMTSPRFNLASSESVNTGEIPDISQQLSQLKIVLPYPENLSVSSIPPAEYHGHSRQASGSHHLSAGLIPYGPSPLQNAHQRLFSLTLSMHLDRVDASASLDFNQNLIHQHLGPNSSHLMPRMKTIEMYRKNAKKLSDPAVLFQYAQYMLQTAILLDLSANSTSTSDSSKASAATAPATPSGQKKLHLRLVLTLSLSLEHSLSPSDPDLRASLLKEALHYLKRLSDKGYVEAQYFLGDAYSSGAFGKVDNKEAFGLFLAAAKRGHTECAFRTAHCYEEGLGTGRDARKGVDFLKMAASKNHPAAMYKLGIYFFYGRMGISDSAVNKKLGIKWLERALIVATELTSAAPYELGKLYQSGYSDILIKDVKYALELFSQAAALGHIEASAILGQYYEIGDIVTPDSNLSIHYYTKAALGGHAQSMLSMCAWYMVGSEPYLPKDEQEAFEWAKRAASCGHGKAQFVMANFLDKGIGCDKNVAEAQAWYIKAAENGQQKALARVQDQKKVAAITKKLKKAKNYHPLTTEAEAQEKDCVIM